MVTTMSLERFYSSVREEVSPLNDKASALLAAEDYVGFFKACGPNYVRGIRRRQEVTAILKFQSSSSQRARQFFAGVKVSNWRSNKSSNRSSSNSLKITIKGWGMGLSSDGSETLVASSIPDYKKAMKFAFTSFTKNKDAPNIGMIYGIEVVPWVYNTEFQAAAALGEDVITVPMPRSLIPNAIRINPLGTTPFSNDVTTRALFKCKNSGFKMDKYGKCCEVDQLFKDGAYVDETVTTFTGTGDGHTCVPLRVLDPNVIKDNLSNNAEFVTRMDSAMRYRFTQLAVLEKCVSAANAIPDRLLFKKLLPKPTHAIENLETYAVSVMQLKIAIDPKGDYGLVTHMAQELDEWIEMFYSPCYAALFGTNVATSPEIDVSYFLAYPWHSHTECMRHLTCLTNTLRWDRENGGCVAGLMDGTNAQDYPSAAHSTPRYCLKKETGLSAATESCKYDSADLKTTQDTYEGCWNNYGVTSVAHMVANYCLPEVTSTSISGLSDTAYKNCRPVRL